MLENAKLAAWEGFMWCEPQSTSEELMPEDSCVEAVTMNTHVKPEMSMTTVESVNDDTYSYGFQQKLGLESFLERPVRVYAGTWSVGSDLDLIIDPWSVLNKTINDAGADKLKNFSWIRANIELTVTLNATNFHYGLVQIAYHPFFGAIGTGSYTNTTAPYRNYLLINSSQKLRMDMDVQSMTTQCMCIPFFCRNSYIDITQVGVSGSNPDTNLGKITMSSYTQLRQLNGGADEVGITVFARMTDVQLTTPTLTEQSADDCDEMWLEPQGSTGKAGKSSFSVKKAPSRTEYGEPVKLSTVATSVAEAANTFAHFPVIGLYARATSIVATGVSKVAALFGFSRPVELGETKFMRNMPTSHMALTSGSDTSQKLSTDPKQELTIDSRTVGLNGQDEMSIAYVAQKESYINTFIWDVTDGSNAELFTMGITPMLRAEGTVDLGVQPTALHYASIPFKNWTGSIVVRFKFVVSSFHKGRYSIIYDPIDDLTSVPVSYMSRIITETYDLDEYNDVEITIPWNQDVAWKETGLVAGYPVSGDDASVFTGLREYLNGRIQVRVINELTTPDAISPVPVMVFIRAGDDFQVLNPQYNRLETIGYSPIPPAELVEGEKFEAESASELSYMWLEPQGLIENQILDDQHDSMGVGTTPDCLNLVYFGERISSFRALCKRFSFSHSKRVGSTGSNFNVIYRLYFNFWQNYFGYGSSEDQTATGEDFNYVGATWYKYVASMYVAYRGGVRYKCSLEGTENSGLMQVTRSTSISSTAIQTVGTGASSASAKYQILGYLGRTTAGVAVTTQNQKMLEFEVPFQSMHRFELVDINRTYTAGPAYNWFQNGYVLSGSFFAPTASVASVVCHSAAADDFSCFYFNAAPYIIIIDTIPPPV